MKLSKQAWILLFTYAIASIVLSGAIVTAPNGRISQSLLAFVMLALAGLIATFDTNCVVEGGCNKFGWLKMVLYAMSPVAITIATIYAFKKMNEPQK